MSGIKFGPENLRSPIGTLPMAGSSLSSPGNILYIIKVFGQIKKLQIQSLSCGFMYGLQIFCVYEAYPLSYMEVEIYPVIVDSCF